MKKEWADKWIKALRSGEYKQTTGMLNKNNESVCCLGVLCELWRQEQLIPMKWETHSSDNNSMGLFGEAAVVPTQISKEIVMYSSIGCIDLPYPARDNEKKEIKLIDLNDKAKLTFPQIADVIAYFWKEL